MQTHTFTDVGISDIIGIAAATYPGEGNAETPQWAKAVAKMIEIFSVEIRTVPTELEEGALLLHKEHQVELAQWALTQVLDALFPPTAR